MKIGLIESFKDEGFKKHCKDGLTSTQLCIRVVDRFMPVYKFEANQDYIDEGMKLAQKGADIVANEYRFAQKFASDFDYDVPNLPDSQLQKLQTEYNTQFYDEYISRDCVCSDDLIDDGIIEEKKQIARLVQAMIEKVTSHNTTVIIDPSLGIKNDDGHIEGYVIRYPAENLLPNQYHAEDYADLLTINTDYLPTTLFPVPIKYLADYIYNLVNGTYKEKLLPVNSHQNAKLNVRVGKGEDGAALSAELQAEVEQAKKQTKLLPQQHERYLQHQSEEKAKAELRQKRAEITAQNNEIARQKTLDRMRTPIDINRLKSKKRK